MLIDTPHTVHQSVAAAQKIASACNADADGWEYVVIPDPKGSGRAVIEVRDEDGIKVGLL